MVLTCPSYIIETFLNGNCFVLGNKYIMFRVAVDTRLRGIASIILI